MRNHLLWALAVTTVSAFGAQSDSDAWRFAVSGDSRNCGDIVMPQIAAGAHAQGAAFYWHLGDFRWIADFDQDMMFARKVQKLPPLSILGYMNTAWSDFIENQLAPFGDTPVYL